MESFNEQEHWVGRVESHLTDQIPEYLAWEQMADKIREDIDAHESIRKYRTGGFVLLFLLIASLCFVSDNKENTLQDLVLEEQHSIANVSTKVNTSPRLIPPSQPANSVSSKNKITSPDDEVKNQLVTSTSKITTTSSREERDKPNLNARKKEAFVKTMKFEQLPALPIKLFSTDEPTSLVLNPLSMNSKMKKQLWQFSIGANHIQFHPNYKSEQQNTTLPSHFEQSMASQQVYFRVHRKLSNRWEISTGIQVQALKYRVDFAKIDTINLYRPMTIDTIFTDINTGERSFAYRDSIPGLRTHTLRQHNQIQSIQFPLLLSYNWQNSRLGLAINGGINTNLRFRSKGKIIFDGTSVLDLADTQNTGVRLSALLEIQASIRINEKVALYGQIGMEQHLINWMNSDYGLSQYPRIQYLGMG
ncbi:MAG: hypothetical protein AAGG68_30105, partial [Bacteroidota bacterium]